MRIVNAWMVGSGRVNFAPRDIFSSGHRYNEFESLTVFSSKQKAEEWRKQWRNADDLKTIRIVINQHLSQRGRC
jgi:hypothetical protein